VTRRRIVLVLVVVLVVVLEGLSSLQLGSARGVVEDEDEDEDD
jgi:hypothetical protein